MFNHNPTAPSHVCASSTRPANNLPPASLPLQSPARRRLPAAPGLAASNDGEQASPPLPLLYPRLHPPLPHLAPPLASLEPPVAPGNRVASIGQQHICESIPSTTPSPSPCVP